MNVALRFKLNELHISSLRKMLSVADCMAEHFVCTKYGVVDIEDLYATDYEEIVEEISKHIGKVRTK